MMIDDNFLAGLTPADIDYIVSYILSKTANLTDNNYEDSDNNTNLNDATYRCPYCGFGYIVKNGHNKNNKQRYLCKSCLKTFSSSTNTIFYKSKLSYRKWYCFISSEINGLTLKETAALVGISVTSCFYMRHKLYGALAKLYDDHLLKEQVIFDCTYFPISLKGTKKSDMPRLSKKRGKSDKAQGKQGFNGHKVCVFTAVDSCDNMIAKIAGVGHESGRLLKPFVDYFDKNVTFIADSSPVNIDFIKQIDKSSMDLIPSGKHTSKNGNSIGEINQMHQELKQLFRNKHSISIRHLQSYLSFYCYLKKLKHKLEATKRIIKTYMNIIPYEKEENYSCKDICKSPLPINLQEVYGDYHYGISGD